MVRLSSTTAPILMVFQLEYSQPAPQRTSVLWIGKARRACRNVKRFLLLLDARLSRGFLPRHRLPLTLLQHRHLATPGQCTRKTGGWRGARWRDAHDGFAHDAWARLAAYLRAPNAYGTHSSKDAGARHPAARLCGGSSLAGAAKARARRFCMVSAADAHAYASAWLCLQRA